MKTSPARANERSSANGQKAPVDKPKWVGHAEWLCAFTILFTGYLWYSSPVKTAAQSYFRLGLVVVGAVGYCLIQAWKWGRSHEAASR